ncbi:MAG: cytochrome c oxidase subunit 3 [Planctomycetota bacterium]|jgi:cytochrome c oxidase subunit 3|nr:cytochrome c oxidase subunit 3 [Planctomycetota bacterium]MDP6764206.1 cytochrome c oxidase subunit 3 [Planctomycetota bacterium]MDP6988295.1 cytochrome c oxidase subunit 3 [Planctomycetota bacterium]
MTEVQAVAADELEPPIFEISWQKLMMWAFIITDALLFSGYLASYMFTRLASDIGWPVQSEVFDMNFITLMTFTLITSSATMACAVKAASDGDPKLTRRYLLLTTLIGLAFLGMQAVEWSHFIGDGARLTGNPWGTGAFSAYFFMMTGFHGTHVLIGVVILLITFLRTSSDRLIADKVEVVGLYWHFVDLVWVFIFGCFYLL